jgi:hypothetical protein
MAKSMMPWVKHHDKIEATATSAVIDCRGYNALAVYATFDAAKNWTFAVLSAPSPDMAFVACYDNAGTVMSKTTDAALMWIFHNIPDYVQLKATEDVDGAKVTVWAAPCIV